MSSWMKIVVSVNVSLNYISFIDCYSSLSCNYNRCAVCFQSFMNIACRSTLNAVRIERFFKITHRYKPLNKKINIKNCLLCWSVTLLMFIQTLYHSSHCKFSARRKWEPAGRPDYWLSAICLEKLWNTAFCPTSVW